MVAPLTGSTQAADSCAMPRVPCGPEKSLFVLPMNLPVTVIVLAAGASSRFIGGGHKLAQPLDNRRRTIRAAAIELVDAADA